MRPPVIALLFLIALALLWKLREHLTPSGTIEAPEGQQSTTGYKRYSLEQEDKIYKSMPESVINPFRSKYSAQGILQKDVLTLVKREIAWIIAQFYADVYSPATAAITTGDINTWIERVFGGVAPPEYRKALETYFLPGQSPEPPPSPTPAETSSSTPQPVQTSDVRAPTSITINVRP